mmetsp:Transcript_51369/g.148278  ORF Transcript_51369/g.148278 Transcript_51369/m.148278 type:complete len:333 (+) Transcript_51369:461-1459(+)
MCVSFQFHFLVNVLGQGKSIIVVGVCNDGIQTEFVDDVLLLVPPPFLSGSFSSNLRRQIFVVPVMVAIVRLVIQDIDFSQPFDHPTANVAGNDKTTRETTIGMQAFSIAFKGDHDLISQAHRLAQRNTRSIFDLLAPWVVFKGTLAARFVGEVVSTDEFYMFSSRIIRIHASSNQNIADQGTLVDASAQGTRAPVESNRLFDHVHFFSTVAATRNCDGKFGIGKFTRQLIHGQLHGLGYFATDFDNMRFPIQLGNSSMISNNMKIGRGEETFLGKNTRRWFTVEWVASCQSYQTSIPWNPLVRCSDIATIARQISPMFGLRFVDRFTLSSFI